ncbi:MAG: hypothetical protein EOO14_25155 [Chitinophagaceae bacterium]|nr:MAG: hypothetical protein EOO14_25155 [Chitinophagaceae bacterium]
MTRQGSVVLYLSSYQPSLNQKEFPYDETKNPGMPATGYPATGIGAWYDRFAGPTPLGRPDRKQAEIHAAKRLSEGGTRGSGFELAEGRRYGWLLRITLRAAVEVGNLSKGNLLHKITPILPGLSADGTCDLPRIQNQITMMKTDLTFIFSGYIYTCEAHVDNSAYPCLVFVRLQEQALTDRFGEKLTIKTNFDGLLPRQDDRPELTMLRQAILDALQRTPEWQTERLLRKPPVAY